MVLFETDPSPSDLSTLVVLVRQRDPKQVAIDGIQGERARHLAAVIVSGEAPSEADLRDLRTIRRIAGLRPDEPALTAK